VGCWQRRLPSPGASVCVTHLAMESRVDSLRPFSPGLRASAPEADAPNRRFWWFVGLMGAAVGAFYFAPVDTWIHDLWLVVLGWAAATTVVVAIRGSRFLLKVVGDQIGSHAVTSHFFIGLLESHPTPGAERSGRGARADASEGSR
jgi:hypothetical protein